MYHIIWCEGSFLICSSGPCHLHNKTKAATGHTNTQQNLHVHALHQFINTFALQHGFPHQPDCSKPIHGRDLNQGNQQYPQPMSHGSAVVSKHFTFNPPSLWLWYVDDTFVIQRAEHIQHFLQHITSNDTHIQFIADAPNTGSKPLLDTLVSPGPDNSLLNTVNRKPTHADQYLHWDRHHNC